MRTRTGFTLIEAVVGVAIAAILAFAFYATFASQGGGGDSDADDRARRAGEAGVVLFDIASAIAALETTNPPVSYLQTVGAYPTRLSQLTTQITTADRNSCDRPADAYNGGAVPTPPAYPGYTQGWKGPYYILAFPLNGTTQLAEGFVVQDDMIRIPPDVGNNPNANALAGRLLIRMPSVSQLDALALDEVVDKTISNSSGTVRYTGSDPTVVDYELRVSGC